jgi:protein ImuB
MPFACISVPDFPVEALVRAQPELRSHAVGVLEGKPPLEKILAVNEAGRHRGLCVGMTKLQAQLGNGVTLRPRSELQESAAHQALVDCAQSFSPQVEDCAADTLVLDLSGLEKLFGPVPNIARAISHRAAQMGLTTNVAVASTLESALIAAHGFSGVTVVPEGKESEFLGSLPVDLLLAGEAVAENLEVFLETFRRWGVWRFRDLAALPEIALSERLGQPGLDLQRRARGAGMRNLVPSNPPLRFEEVLELEYPIVLLEPLAFLLHRMLGQLCARLEARALGAQELRLELQLENGRRSHPAESGGEDMPSQPEISQLFQRTIRLPVPLVDQKTFLQLLQLDLKANPPGAPLLRVRLEIEPAKPRPAQNGFFVPSFPEPEKLELTLARIQAIVGKGRAGSPIRLDRHGRDAFAMRHFTPSAHKNQTHSLPPDPVTALRIFRPPIAVWVNYQNGRPSQLRSEKARPSISGKVLWAAGPWRSSGDWWDEDAWLRDEWDIAVEEKVGIALYRLVHDLISGQWLLEGSYD